MGDTEKSKRIAFVTVGTTCFDALVRAVDTPEVKRELFNKGYTDLLIQMGRGTYTPMKGLMGDTVKSKRIAFVTFGTTCFDALVRAVDTPEVKRELFNKGYTDLLIQMGRGTYTPMKSSGEDGRCLAVDYFTFSSSIADSLKSASLVISHAGSGSIFETLRVGKPLIVVVNEDLMDNHQSELAEALAERNHLFCADPKSLCDTITNMRLETLLPYQPGDARPVAKLINRFLGFPDD